MLKNLQNSTNYSIFRLKIASALHGSSLWQCMAFLRPVNPDMEADYVPELPVNPNTKTALFNYPQQSNRQFRTLIQKLALTSKTIKIINQHKIKIPHRSNKQYFDKPLQ